MNWSDFDPLLDAALTEDAVSLDATTRALVPGGLQVLGRVIAREEGVACGLALADRLVTRFGHGLSFKADVSDGDRVARGQVIAEVRGPAAPMLSLERAMLNFLQHLSGVACLTAQFADAVHGTRAAIYDTRKTTPGWRELEKYAVTCGGGCNHRPHLAGAVLIKDNHLALARDGDVGRAVRRAREVYPGLTVEVEVEDMDQLREALTAGPDIILLDNMTPAEVRRAAGLTRETCPEDPPLLEASGGITLENVRQYAEAGADRISIGALTHSAPAMDISMEIEPCRD